MAQPRALMMRGFVYRASPLSDSARCIFWPVDRRGLIYEYSQPFAFSSIITTSKQSGEFCKISRSPRPDCPNHGHRAEKNTKLYLLGKRSSYGAIALPHGANVFGCDIDLSAAEYTASRLRDEGGICDVIAAGVTSSADVQRVVDAVLAKYGRIDILINNVSLTAPGDPGTMTEELWDRQMDINLKSIYLGCHAVLPVMERQGSGSIINNASIAGIRYLGKPQAAYSAAKAAVIQFTKVMRSCSAPKGVRLNCVVPGMIYTPLVEGFGISEKEDDREIHRRITQHNVPMGRMGDAFDVANAAVFLVGNAAKYITGQEIVIDGGLTSLTGT